MSLSGRWPPSRPYNLHLTYNDHSLGHVRGLTFLTDTKRPQNRCHYFGAVPYALPPVRFKRPVPLPDTHTYGTAENPTVFIDEVSVCPQPGDFGAFPDSVDMQEWNEDCLQCNIWIPAGTPPHNKGWPVLVFFHGGYLQFGSPNGSDYIGLCDTTRTGNGQCIIVLPGYRTNVFGFLASKELQDEGGSAGNYGFWDQRCALEWVRDRIGFFGGDIENMTLGGYSAGALSSFHQLSHNFALPAPQRLPLRRILMLANGTGIQPRSIAEVQPQFDELVHALDIPANVSGAAKLESLRSKSSQDIVEASLKITLHEFRHVTDNAFVSPALFRSLDSGAWVQQFVENDCELLIGECETEHFAFATWHTPIPNTLRAVKQRLSVDYPAELIEELCRYFCADGELPVVEGRKCVSWSEFFGILYAEIQVHATHRGFVDCLYEFGAGSRVRRCRVGWRAKRADKNFPRDMGATHGTDTALWFWGDGVGLELLRREEVLARTWCRPYWEWLMGRGFGSWTEEKDRRVMRYIDGQGKVKTNIDECWSRGLEVWEIIKKVQGRRVN